MQQEMLMTQEQELLVTQGTVGSPREQARPSNNGPSFDSKEQSRNLNCGLNNTLISTQ